MSRKYDIRLRATIEIGGVYEAETVQEAKAIAESELRSQGEIGDIEIDRAIFLDDENPLEA